MAQAVAQFDLTGGVVSYKPATAKSKLLTMQEIHGTKDGCICGDCAHAVKFNHGVTVYKCVKWKFTPNSISDINPLQTACNKFVSC